MHIPLSTERTKLLELLGSGRFVLFLGAGVSVEAGIRPWGPALRELADVIDSPGSPSHLYAEVIRQEVATGRYLHAAEQFYLAPLTPEQQAQALTTVFGKPPTVTPRLRALARQPYRAVVTTNFDMSFLNACTSEGVALVQYGESPGDMAAARVSSGRFFLRLHGRIEVPSTLVLSRSQYDRLKTTVPQYPFFIQSLLSDVSIVFFGFSFTDPFFCALLENIRDASLSRARNTSYALLSDAPSEPCATLLAGLNIIPLTYSNAQAHEEAWSLFATSPPPGPLSDEHYTEGRIRHTLAGVLAHLRIQGQPDLQAAVLGAATLASLEEAGGSGSISAVIDRARADLALPPASADLIKSAVAQLVSSGRATLMDNTISLPPAPSGARSPSAEAGVTRVIKGILARAEVRYNHRPAPSFDYDACLKEVLLRVLAADGMALAHSFVRGQGRDVSRVDAVVAGAVSSLDTTARRRAEPLRDAIVGVLTRPERDEEEALDELAALSFVVCLTLSDPSLPALAERMVRHPVFLDASIVLPWMSHGHPSERVYGTIVESLGTARLADTYVNEIVSHRRLALGEYEGARLEDRKRFELYAHFYGLNNVNTFIGGFGGSLAAEKDLSFPEYISRVAPFKTEGEAADFLRKKGLGVQPLGHIAANLPHIQRLLADKLQAYGRRRDTIRISHDAMMAGYLLDRGGAARPYFVTADRSLIGALTESPYAHVVSHVLFPHQAFALAQMTGRAHGLVRGLARTVFGVGRDASKQLREFYTDRVLAEYEPALVGTVPSIVEKILDQIDDTRTSLNFTLSEDDDAVNERVRRFTALDQFEREFHETMAVAKKAAGRA